MDPNNLSEPAVAYSQLDPYSIEAILEVESSDINEPLRRLNTFRKGLSKRSFDALKEVSGLDYNTLATALAVSSKTLQRKDVFDVVQSEKMYELAELYSIGISYFGQAGFKRWMERPLFSLGNCKPIDLIDVSEGMAILKAEIKKLQHGIAI